MKVSSDPHICARAHEAHMHAHVHTEKTGKMRGRQRKKGGGWEKRDEKER